MDTGANSRQVGTLARVGGKPSFQSDSSPATARGVAGPGKASAPSRPAAAADYSFPALPVARAAELLLTSRAVLLGLRRPDAESGGCWVYYSPQASPHGCARELS